MKRNNLAVYRIFINIRSNQAESKFKEGAELDSFNYRGWSIKYEHTGQGSPVILLHNGGTSHVIWREIIPFLSDDYELFAFDLLGYGDSDKPDTGYTLDNYIDFLSAFVDHHRLAPVNIVGNCMGSAMSLGFAARRPEAVRALVLINPLTRSTFLAGSLGPTLRLRQRAPGLSRKIYGRLGRINMPARLGPAVFSFQVGPRGRKSKINRSPELCSCFASPGLMKSLLGVLDDLDNYAYLDQMKFDDNFPPVCTIWGAQNKVLSPKAGRGLNNKIKPLRQEWLEGCGHLLMLEEPEKTARIIKDFFSQFR